MNMTKTIIQLVVAILLIVPVVLRGQMTVGGETPDPSAILDMQSTSKGFMLPRISTTDRNTIANPAKGLIIFNTSTYCMEINQGTPSAPQWQQVNCRTGVISAINCSNSVVAGTLKSGEAASGVSVSVPYTGGNGGVYKSQSITSTGVTGLTATLSAGSFTSDAGTLSYSITGTPASGGTASFALNIGGQTCTLGVCVNYVCRAKVNSTDYKAFLCYNLGAANTCADPFTPSWEINGGYWQWGRLAQAAPGPTATDPNGSAISGWNTDDPPNGSLIDESKTANDPCPTGYRIPTVAQLSGILTSNTVTSTGTFVDLPTNYSVGKKFGDQLMLPVAGERRFSNGFLRRRGLFGAYWSSTEEEGGYARYLRITSSSDYIDSEYLTYGYSVRCIEE